jgi:hypothetical protein
MYLKMLLKNGYPPITRGWQLRDIVETKGGVITVNERGTIYGGGIYDGGFNVSLVHDSNGIQRAFALSYFHPNPKEVLMVGLSSGSWAQVIANHPQLEHLTIVEINSGYLRLVRKYPEVASLLQNPKVHVEIDDGRRWLIRNPERKFDVIVMNTTYSWRSNASNLLSVDFLEMVRRHLNPGGVQYYNTTGSKEVLATGVKVFPYGMRIAGLLMVSDTPLQLDAARWYSTLLKYKIDGRPVFDLSKEDDRRRFAEVMAMPTTMDQNVSQEMSLESAEHIRARTADARIITDDNMGTEWWR